MKRHSKGFIIQNPPLAALLLWRFTRTYYEHDERSSGPGLPQAMLVLPIVFHRPSVETIRGMQLASGLIKALDDNPMMRIGLQDRVEALAEVSFSGLNFGCATKLIDMTRGSHNGPHFTPTPRPKHLPEGLKPDADSVRDMIRVAERLGPWFARTELRTLCSMLHVKF